MRSSLQNILLTGGAGYLGSVLVPLLLETGYKVTVVDNFAFGQTSLLDCCWKEGFSIIRGDCRDERVMASLLAKADAIVPLAALVGAPHCQRDQIAARTTNVEAIRMICRLTSSAQCIVIPSTNSCYGEADEGIPCTEESPLRPLSLYGTTKCEAERMVMERSNGLSFRFATLFGMSPRMRVDLLVNDFVHRAVTDRALVIFEGHFKRNYLHVRDAAHAILHGLNRFSEMSGRAYNCGLEDANLSKIELCQEIQKQVPDFVFFEAPIGKDPDQRNYSISNARLHSTGFEPTFSLTSGIRELIQGFQIVKNARYVNF